MSIRLFVFSGAPCSRRVEIALTFKQQDFETVVLKASERSEWSDALFRMNHRGKVPVLVSDGLVIRDSLAILGWLDAAFPELPLFGRSAEEIARAWALSREADEYLLPAVSHVVFPAFGSGADDPNIASDPALIDARDKLLEELSWLEALLHEEPYFLGDIPGAADAVIYPDIARIERAIDTRPRIMTALGFATLRDVAPRLADWADRIAALPGIGATTPPHWRAAA